jgi:preprotein translocase subunit SecA
MPGVLFQSTRRLLRSVNAWEVRLKDENDAVLKRRSLSLRYRAQAREPLTSLIGEAFALVREASRRTTGMRHFDVQMLGGIAMARRRLAEMQTGEGKTLTATLPLYLHALSGKGAHLATVNDYLARRDAELMQPIYAMLGMSVGVVEANLSPEARRRAYACDITYGTAKEFGFDFLRDHLLQRDLQGRQHGDWRVLGGEQASISHEKPVGRGLHFALVDEADSILIDEAGTPLIISACGAEHSLAVSRYRFAAVAARSFVRDVDYVVDQRRQRVDMTGAGRQHIRALSMPLCLDAVDMVTISDDIERALRCGEFFHRDRQYVVTNGVVHIVDEFTGRVAEGRRWREGVHQAVEAQEGLQISPAGGQAARVTVQDFFLRYRHLAGMSGTALSAACELKRIYKLRVSVIPTNRPPIRRREATRIFAIREAKLAAIVDEVRALHEHGRPVLIGTRSIDQSQELSAQLNAAGLSHQVLNAHEVAQEAEIIAKAGHAGRITVATNMAGRGTDILLGPCVADLGGLHVICTEMHESARIDRQLIGRCGRQGDPGSYRQYLSLDDELLDRGLGVAKAKRLRRSWQSSTDLAKVQRWFVRAQRLIERRSFRQRQALLWQEKASMRSCREMGLDPHLDAVD